MAIEEGHRCVLPFDTDEAEFARGFEAGRVWALLCTNPDAEVEEIVHASNAEMFLRMAERAKRSVTAEEQGDDWMVVRFSPAET